LIGSSVVAKRYAQALFDLAGEEKDYMKFQGELKTMNSLIEGSRDLKEFFGNPVFEDSEKKAVLVEVLKKTSISPLMQNFLKLLVDKGRINSLADISECYEGLVFQALKMSRVNVRTAFPLNDDTVGKIKAMLEKMTGKSVEMMVEQDPSLIAGMVVKIGDKVYDGSIKSQLNNIRQLLGEEK
jgi:F-type H+-transporting ATPase subunit delta